MINQEPNLDPEINAITGLIRDLARAACAAFMVAALIIAAAVIIVL